jgi:hypothetical protein
MVRAKERKKEDPAHLSDHSIFNPSNKLQKRKL